MADAPQAELFSEEELTLIETATRVPESQTVMCGEYSGDDFARRFPVHLALALKLFAVGASLRQIRWFTGASTNTLTALSISQSAEIETLRREVRGRWALTEKLAQEEMLERLLDPVTRKKIPFRDLSLAAAVARDKQATIAGQPTEIKEVRFVGMDAQQALDAAVAKALGNAVTPIEVTDVTPVVDAEGDQSTDSAALFLSQKGEAERLGPGAEAPPSETSKDD